MNIEEDIPSSTNEFDLIGEENQMLTRMKNEEWKGEREGDVVD